MTKATSKVLVASLNSDLARLVEEMLPSGNDLRFNSKIAEPREVLSELQAQKYDLCLVDLTTEPGFDILTDVSGAFPDLPLILLAADEQKPSDINHPHAECVVFSTLNPSLLRSTIRFAIRNAKSVQALRVSEERFALAALGSNDGLWDWDLESNQTFFSPRWKSLLGYHEDEIGNSPEEWFSRVHPEDYRELERRLAAHLDGQTPHFQYEHRMLDQKGNYHWILSRGIAVRDSSGRAYRMAGSQTDITERKLAEDRLHYDSQHDSLTGLSNRQSFMERLRRSLHRSRISDDYIFAVLFLDLDRFKIINDSLGHQMGDHLLVEIARRLETTLRPSDMMARLGGDEFVVLLDHLHDESDAAFVAKRILKVLASPFHIEDREVFTSASIGITLSTRCHDTAEDMLRDADTALYRAKSSGKARFAIFDPKMRESAVRLMQLETDMRRAIAKSEFFLNYQPIISLESGRLTGFESLIRWNHPERGLISPAEFIPMSEDNGLINPIGRWVLHESCRQLREWHKTYPSVQPVTMNVNISGRQFSQPDLIDTISRTLKDTGLDAQYLKLEITESVLMENAESAAEMLAELKALGSQLAIDDFGTGYSSFSHLHKFPIDTLKIDRAFVSRMDTSSESAEIVKTILMLGHNLRMQVVAEGVETSSQVKHLRSLGCDYGQGFYLGMPLDPVSAKNLISEESSLKSFSVFPRNEDFRTAAG